MMPKLSPTHRDVRRLSPAGAHIDFLRMLLISAVSRVIRTRRLSATDVTESLGVPSTRVSALLHSQIDAFTIDELVQIVARTEVELALAKTNPVDEETFDGPLCRASGSGLHATLHARLAAMAARESSQKDVTLEGLIEALAAAGIRFLFATPL